MSWHRKMGAFFLIILRFIQALLSSGIGVLMILMRYATRRKLPPTAYVRLKVTPMSDWGMSLLAAMITLTPGTTAIDIDQEHSELLLHVLDARDPMETVRYIRECFVPPLLVFFAQYEQERS